MLKFLLDFFKSRIQLQPEIVFLRKQLEILNRSSWQNGYCERVIGSIRREFLDHVIVITENHLRKLLNEYFYYYNHQRTHLGLNKDSPETRPAQVIGKIENVPMANGLHNYYYRKAA